MFLLLYVEKRHRQVGYGYPQFVCMERLEGILGTEQAYFPSPPSSDDDDVFE